MIAGVSDRCRKATSLFWGLAGGFFQKSVRHPRYYKVNLGDTRLGASTLLYDTDTHLKGIDTYNT